MPLTRKTPMKRGGRIKPKKRTPEESERIYGTPEKVAWMKAGMCWHCGRKAGPYRSIAIAHIQTGGTGRKDDASRTIRLCETPGKYGCHDAQHQHGWSVLASLATKEQREAAAAITNDAWAAFQQSSSPEGTR